MRRRRKRFKPMSKRKEWAIKRNWLILRLRGANSVFSTAPNMEFFSSLVSTDCLKKVKQVDKLISEILKEVSASTWRGEEV